MLASLGRIPRPLAFFAFAGIVLILTFGHGSVRTRILGEDGGEGAEWYSWKWQGADSSQHSGQLWDVPAVYDPQDNDNYKWYTEAKLRSLAACAARGDCPKNSLKVVIFAAYHCHATMFLDYNGGEGVWCKSMIKNIESQGYTVLHARDDWRYVYHIHRQIPDLVKVIIGVKDGITGKAKDYYKSEARPDGIPAWKHFLFEYYPHMGDSVVGDRWTICAEPDWRPEGQPLRNFTLGGYALHPSPDQMPFVPHSERPHRAYVFSKRVQYFYKWSSPSWEPDYFARAQKELQAIWPDFEFVGGFTDDRSKEQIEEQGPMPVPEGITDLGKMNAEQWDAEVARSRVMVGLGWPPLSPSPYRALAMGVPFINPFKVKPNTVETDMATWGDSQHTTLRYQGPPLVYHTKSFDYDAFVRSIKLAMETPVDPWRAAYHSEEALSERMRHLMEADWRAEAAWILENRLAGNETQGKGGGWQLGIFSL